MKFKKKQKLRIKKVFKFTTKAFIILYFIILITSMLAEFIPPSFSTLPSFLALFFLSLVSIFFLILIFSIYSKKYKYFPIFIPIFTLSLYNINNYIPFLKLFEQKPKGNKPIKILSYNVRLFDRYNWKNNYIFRQPILDYIVKENPDIGCFQEYYYQSDGKYPTTEYLQKKLKAKNINCYFSINLRKTNHFGIATFSVFPIVNKKIIKFENTSNIILITDILINNDTVRVYNVHLESVRLSEEDIVFLKNPENLTSNYEKTSTIFQYLKRAFLKREIQVDSLINDLKKCKYPVILCGDLNDIPVSYTYKKINKFLNNAYNGFDLNLGSTYNGPIPFLRIDNIFYSNHFSSKNFKIETSNKLSDHYPISCELFYNKN